MQLKNIQNDNSKTFGNCAPPPGGGGWVGATSDYYPGGMLMPGRSYSSDSYRFGFNGQEKDDEWSGQTGSHLNYRFREYDSRICRFFAIDPITAQYPMLTPYQHSSLNPIWKFELEGLEGVVIGGADVFSEGEVSQTTKDITENIQTNLTKAGIDTKVQSFNVSFDDAQQTDVRQTDVYKNAYNFIKENYDPEKPLAIYGYSHGGTVASALQADLLSEDIKVDLLFLVDATPGMGVEYTPIVPSNVNEAFNFYQTKTNLLGSRGYPAKKTFSSNETKLFNLNVTSLVPNQPGQMPSWAPSSLQETNKHSNIDEIMMNVAIRLMTKSLSR